MKYFSTEHFLLTKNMTWESSLDFVTKNLGSFSRTPLGVIAMLSSAERALTSTQTLNAFLDLLGEKLYEELKVLSIIAVRDSGVSVFSFLGIGQL